MANIVSILSYTNTFGDLLSQQNRVAVELNNLAANNYTKDSGTLVINSANTGLTVTGGTILGSGIVANTFSVGGDVTALANVFLNGAGTTLTVSNNANILKIAQANTILANTIAGVGATLNIGPSILSITSPTLTATNTTATFNTLATTGSLQVGGNFVLTGSTVYATNNFTVGAGLAVPGNGTFAVYRPGANTANAEIRWNETRKYIEVNNPLSANDLANTLYFRVLTDEFRNDSTYNGGSTNVATSNAVSYLQGVANTANVRLQSIETINTNQNTSITQVNQYAAAGYAHANNAYTSSNLVNQYAASGYAVANGANGLASGAYGHANNAFNSSNNTNAYAVTGFARANTSANAFVGTSGIATPSTGVMSFASTNGLTVTGTSNVLTISTSQNLRANDSPTFNGLSLTTFSVSSTATAPIANVNSNTNIIATTEFVKDVLMSANTFAISTTGNAYNINQYTINQNLGTSSDVQHGSFGVGTAASGTTGEILATNNITAYYSDMRLKNKLGNIENALGKIMTLSGFYYEANEIAQALGYEVKKEVGVSAQEVQAIMPEIVKPAPIDNQYLTVQYEKLVPLLIEAIKELKVEIDDIKKKIG
jgi:hypothetical protein